MIGDIICTIIVVLIVSAMILIAYALCKSASRYDQISMYDYIEYCRTHGDDGYGKEETNDNGDHTGQATEEGCDGISQAEAECDGML